MDDKEILVKTIKKNFTSQIKAGITWFKFISAINNIKLAQRELELLAFINYRGTISSSSAKEDFCKLFDSSFGTISNISAKLLRAKEKLLVKEKSKIKINPALRIDFSKECCIRLFMNVGISTKPNEEINDDENRK